MSLKRIPFDAVTLRAVVAELEPHLGAKVQEIRQPNESEVGIEWHGGAGTAMLLLACHAELFRVHLSTRRPRNQPNPPAFCAALRARLRGGRLVGVGQYGMDRILEMLFDGEAGPHRLIAELMGKHSNLILVGPDGRVVSSAKSVPRSRSVRPIQSGIAYALPPVTSEQDRAPEDASRFFAALLAATPAEQQPSLRAAVAEGRFSPVFVAGKGAYPVSVEALGYSEIGRPSVSVALEQAYSELDRALRLQSARASLAGPLERVRFAREVALQDLARAERDLQGVPKLQQYGDLILAYLSQISPGATQLEAWDFEGNPVQIPLNPEKSPKENAQRFFDKAKRAKARASGLRDQKERLSEDLTRLEAMIARLEGADQLEVIEELREEAIRRRWIMAVTTGGVAKSERPFEGHRIREMMAPHGFQVLFGENAEANDYLTLRVAKPNDWWLHVRGNISAHVVIPTRNQPERVPPEVLQFAASLAAANSPAKHSSYVAVDLTLRKYVRRPRGAPKGTVLYTHERTLHVTPNP